MRMMYIFADTSFWNKSILLVILALYFFLLSFYQFFLNRCHCRYGGGWLYVFTRSAAIPQIELLNTVDKDV